MMIARAVALILGLALAGAAFAQSGDTVNVPRLKSAVTVNRDVVRIGDLVENAGDASDVAIFRAPDLGGTGTVSATKVLDALRANNLLIVDTAGVNEIEVTRASRVIARKDVEQRIASAYAGQYGLGPAERLVMTFEREPRTVYADPSASTDLQVVRSAYDPRTTRFDITLRAAAAVSGRESTWRYTGTLVEMLPAVIPTRPLSRGDVIKAADFTVEKRPKAEIPYDALTSAEDVLGFATRQSLRAGMPLRRADLTKPELVKRDEYVTLFYEVPGITMTMRGKALESGAEGDTISVVNVQSKRTVQGIVDGVGRVIIGPTPTTGLIDTADAAQRAGRKTE